MSKATIRNIVIAAVLMIGAIVVFCLVFNKVTNEGGRLTTQVEALAKQRQQEDSFFKLKRLFETTKVDRKELASHFLLKESDSIDFLNQVELLAKEQGVELDGKGLDKVQDKESNTTWIEVGYGIKASKERVKTFIKILETSPYTSRIMSVDMRSVTKTEWQADVKIRVMVLTYE